MNRQSSLWHHPDFVRLWAGESVSIFGTFIGQMAMQFTAILWLHAGPTGVAVLAACGLVPGFAGGLVAGVWVDRLRRRPIMIAADIGRLVALATIPLAAVFDVLTMAQLCAVASVSAILTVFFDVAYEAYLPTLVKPHELVEGNSKLTASASVAEFASFGASGWLVQLLRGPGAVLVDAVSFLASAFAVWWIQTPETAPAPAAEREHAVREAIEGVRTVIATPVLRSLALAGILAWAGAQMLGVVYLLYLSRELGFSPGVLGVIFGIGGLTSLAGAAFASRRSGSGGLGRGLAIAATLRAAGSLFMPLAGSASLLGGASLVTSQLVTDPAWTYYDINAVSLRQAITANQLLGRVNATVRFAEFGAQSLGVVLGGVLGQAIGYRETLFVAVGIQLAAVVPLLAGPVIRLEQMPHTSHAASIGVEP